MLGFCTANIRFKAYVSEEFLTGIVLVLVLNPFLLPKQTEASN